MALTDMVMGDFMLRLEKHFEQIIFYLLQLQLLDTKIIILQQ